MISDFPRRGVIAANKKMWWNNQASDILVPVDYVEPTTTASSTVGDTSMFTQESTSPDEKTKSPPEKDDSYDDDYSDDSSSASKHLGKYYNLKFVTFPFSIQILSLIDKVSQNSVWIVAFILDFSGLTTILLSSMVLLLSTLTS